jgi:pyruvate/2-oxoglutarate dehydrogenase complex dihydrolipoamide acyltransferase (E2) component
VGEVIAKLAEDAYFMRIDNRVTQAPPPRTREHENHEATSRSPADNGRNCTRGDSLRIPTVPGHQLEDLLRVATVLAAPVVVAALLVMVMLAAEAAAAGAPHTGLVEEPVVEAITKAEATATSPAPHAAATMPAAELKKYDATSPPRQATTTASPPSPLDFAIYSFQRNSNLWGSPSTTRSKT